jgi:hypothetical protein
MHVNFAERAHNHNWKLDPIVRSLLDTDFYKLLMLQFIWKNFPAIHVTSRSQIDVSVLLAEHIPMSMCDRRRIRWAQARGRNHLAGRQYLLWQGLSLSLRFWTGWRTTFVYRTTSSQSTMGNWSYASRAVDRGDDGGFMDWL